MEMEYITSRQNPLVVGTVKLFSARKHRTAQGLMAADGTKLLEEAVRWSPELLHTVILREGLPWPALPDHVRRVTVPPQLMAQLSPMESPEGAVFLMRLPQEEPGRVVPGTLVLDGLQDPGNVGTILRTADAFSVPVLLGDGCADPYNPKTLRAAMGAVFRSPPRRIGTEDLICQCRENHIPLLAAALSPEARDARQADLRAGAVVVGSEGQGVSDALLSASDGQIILPMSPRCESLNAAAAAAVLLWQMTAL